MNTLHLFSSADLPTTEVTGLRQRYLVDRSSLVDGEKTLTTLRTRWPPLGLPNITCQTLDPMWVASRPLDWRKHYHGRGMARLHQAWRFLLKVIVLPHISAGSVNNIQILFLVASLLCFTFDAGDAAERAEANSHMFPYLFEEYPGVEDINARAPKLGIDDSISSQDDGGRFTATQSLANGFQRAYDPSPSSSLYIWFILSVNETSDSPSLQQASLRHAAEEFLVCPPLLRFHLEFALATAISGEEPYHHVDRQLYKLACLPNSWHFSDTGYERAIILGRPNYC
ncbi:uncharacterized protein BDR25DRAFT_348327 [Lindgomyces ingoldianus]|uniref:Uncharacterized protein n=1 Tax=Lindgomyces ingoldianus TaxID=673940 RepID=A0ACB6RFK2_9PLEO|nr:uncharacterized protein BDR25DRAFT_348327 [Lindgomyces ingoldianus]KAF2478044.1 hypothetical protein BDR25DRAFT_348327 [Lindgomyces ingoldianus]